MYFQRADANGQMAASRMYGALMGSQDKFDLYEMPSSAPDRRGFVLSSPRWPGKVLGFKATPDSSVNSVGAYGMNLDKGLAEIYHDADAAQGHYTVELFLCEIVRERPHEARVQVGAKFGSHGATVWAYVDRSSLYVFGTLGNPGTEGTWLPEPPLPRGLLPECPR